MDNTKGIGKPPHDTLPLSQGKNYILAIGIDHYDNHRSLKNAVADAKAFVDLMTNRYGFELLNEPLYDKAATQRNIRKALGKCESLGEHDRLIVFYSGHGWYKTASKLGYLVPTEAEDDPNSDFIPFTSIIDIFRAVDAHHILLVVDCCFGGSFGVERNVTVDQKMTTHLIAKLDKKKSRMLLSSGDIEPVSDGLLAENNSPFTKPLIEILTENQAPEMAFSEFFRLLCKKVAWNVEQTPQYKVLQHLGHAEGELALFCTDLETPEERAYKAAMETQSISLLEKFLRDFKQSTYKASVRALLKEKRADLAWGKIKNSHFIEDFDEYIEQYPDSPFAALAQQKMDDLQYADEETERLNRENEDKERKAKAEKAEVDRRERAHLAKIEADKQKQERQYQAKIKRQQEETKRKKQETVENERQKGALLKQLEPEMVFVKGGSFNREGQKVSLSDFYIGKYPVTQKQWQAIMGNNPSGFKGENLPVENVSWEDCQLFIKKMYGKTGIVYRLPTEAEWEFAARGGNDSKGFEYSGSHNIDEVAWYRENSGGKIHSVGTKKANEMGIYDMCGNVWEWCNDWYGHYNNTAVTNPKGAKTGSGRVHRGGSCFNSAQYCGVSFRNFNESKYCDGYIGFRLVLSLK